MSMPFALRHTRQLSSVATTAVSAAVGMTTASATGAISISKGRSRLKSEFDPNKALHIYSSVSKNSSSVSTCLTLDTIVQRLARSNRFSEVEAHVESHETDPRITQEAFISNCISSYGRAGAIDQALKIYNQMEELVRKLFDEIFQKHYFTPNKILFGIWVKAYCESGSTELATVTLKKMEKGIEVAAIIYSTIMDALYKSIFHYC